MSITGPVEIEAPQGLMWKGGIYSGPFVLQPDAYGSWTLVEKVPMHRYLYGVVPYEIGFGSPPAALAAQAVLARTWALANAKRFSVDGYHLCSDTQCQVYKDPSEVSEVVKNAIAITAGKVLSWNKYPINAVYHASNGGVMASGAEAWSMAPKKYLRAQLDAPPDWINNFALPLDRDAVALLLEDRVSFYGKGHKLFRWERTYTAEQLKNILEFKRQRMLLPTKVSVLKRGGSGRVVELEIRTLDKKSTFTLRLDEIRRTLRDLPSTLFVVNQVSEKSWQFVGGGFGHGAGLSQAGAIDLARMGWTSEQILRHYYPGTIYGPLPDSW